MNQEHYRKLEGMYHNAPCNQYYKPKMTIGDGEAELIIEFDPKFCHGGGAVHGATYFKMLDDAAYFAVSSLVDDAFVLTAHFNIHLLRPITQGQMRAIGRVVMASPTLYTAESNLYDWRGKEAGRGSGSFVRGKRPLRQEMGYAAP